MRRFLFWLVWNVPLGPLAKTVFDLAMGQKGQLVKTDPQGESDG